MNGCYSKFISRNPTPRFGPAGLVVQLHLGRLATIARSSICDTQASLMMLITQACAAYSEILAVEICLRKS